MDARYVILADSGSPGYDFARAIHEDLSKRSRAFELGGIKVKEFRDGERKPKILANLRGRDCYFIHDSNKNPAVWFLDLCLINEALSKSSAHQIIDVFPYHKFARQDRKDESRVPISAKVIARAVDDYAHGVLTLDVHNPAIDGFYESRFDNLPSFPTAVKCIKPFFERDLSNLVIMSPDAGGGPRAQSFAKRLGVEQVVIGYKTRSKNGDIDGLHIAGDVSGRDILIIDDIVDSGGTLVKACEAARRLGARRIYGYAPHGLFTKGVSEVVSSFDKFWIGNTLNQESHDKLEVIPFAPLFADALYRMTSGQSLSELFD
ncbi:ribose-phosphate diphosphokinase [Candidatus Pacearchaeota archaeon]|nr:ribose-phosphate diphosphokinase [Candidatus Pacearchaeota archaeon]